MDAYGQKAPDPAGRARIAFADGCYTVPSQFGTGSYTVILGDDGALCECPDFELRGKDRKHIMAVKVFARRQKRGVQQDTTNTEPAPKVKPKSSIRPL